MAKRTSKNASSTGRSKEESGVKELSPVEPHKKVEKKPRAKKAITEGVKKGKPTLKSVEGKEEKSAPEKGASVRVKKEALAKKPVSKEATPAQVKKERTSRSANKTPGAVNGAKPSLRSVYSNNKHTLMVLGFGSDFQTKKSVVIFSDLLTGQVHTIALSLWNRWRLKEVKKINTET